MKFKSSDLRKWSRIIHRDLSFFFSGMVLIYAISGIVMNHRDTINPKLIIITVSGIVMLKGKKGLIGRGGVELVAGIVIPLIFLFFF